MLRRSRAAYDEALHAVIVGIVAIPWWGILRAEFEQGPTERYNRLIGGFDPNAELPITAAAQAAYARNPVPELAAANFVVKGGSIYPGSGGTTRQAIQSELMWLPRIAGAYQIGSKTVLRAGYGLFFDPIDVLNWAGPDQTGFSRTTSTNLTNNFGVTWLAGNPTQGISPLTDPFPVRADGTRFDVPVRDALGLMARAGSGCASMTAIRRTRANTGGAWEYSN